MIDSNVVKSKHKQSAVKWRFISFDHVNEALQGDENFFILD